VGSARFAVILIGMLGAGCISPVIPIGSGKTAKQAQHDTMVELGPTRLGTGERWQGEVTTKKIRVWADNEYRAQNVKWEASFEEQLELANNAALTPLFGIRLVAEYAVWNRAEPGATLSDAIDALHELDPGTDVFAVIGLTSSLSLVSATMDQLGLATLNGRHVMLRGYADLAERKMYANAFPDLTPEERELALQQLRRHKTAAVLLHELGHILGVEHETDDSSIMNAAYSNHATQFTPQARQVMLANVDARLQRSRPGAATAVAQATPAAAAAPPSSTALPAVRHAPVTIRVTRKRVTIVDDKPRAPEELDAMIADVLAQDPRTHVIISEDKNLPVGTTGDLIDHLKTLGVQKIEFAWSGH
jgi:biopolymer transport protein ExbD